MIEAMDGMLYPLRIFLTDIFFTVAVSYLKLGYFSEADLLEFGLNGSFRALGAAPTTFKLRIQDNAK